MDHSGLQTRVAHIYFYMYKPDGVRNAVINLGSALFLLTFLKFKVLKVNTGKKTTYNCAINKLQASRGNTWSRSKN